ncbi:MAG: amphi-Trp domain-containing protein [Pseudomonadales bacterium]|nr:amphi-Trp domain-containing protein [Pseudomonadales bacterium]
MELLEVKEKRSMRREEAAKLLHQLADALAKQNSLRFSREGINFVVKVADQVDVELEVEIEEEGNSLEIEIKW